MLKNGVGAPGATQECLSTIAMSAYTAGGRTTLSVLLPCQQGRAAEVPVLKS